MEFEIFNRKFEFFTSTRQFEKFYAYFHEFASKPAVFIVLLIGVVYFAALYFSKRNENIHKKMIYLLPFWYIAFIIAVYLLDRTQQERELLLSFDDWRDGASKLHESSIIVFFIDMIVFNIYGYILQYSWKTVRRSIFIVIDTAVLIEALQYVFSTGVASVSDLFAFSVGGIIGIVIYTIFNRNENEKGGFYGEN